MMTMLIRMMAVKITIIVAPSALPIMMTRMLIRTMTVMIIIIVASSALPSLPHKR